MREDRGAGTRDSVHRAAKEVFRELGTGHSESIYETALELELRLRAMGGPILRQVPCPIRYKGHTVGVGFIDMLIDDILVVELKAVAKLSGRDETQVMKYLAGIGQNSGLLINFNQVSGEVETAEIFNRDDSESEVERVDGPTARLQLGSEATTTGGIIGSGVTTTTSNTVISFGSTSRSDPPDPSLVGVPCPSAPPTLSGGQALDLPLDHSEAI